MRRKVRGLVLMERAHDVWADAAYKIYGPPSASRHFPDDCGAVNLVAECGNTNVEGNQLIHDKPFCIYFTRTDT
jgi:hypothetical protein